MNLSSFFKLHTTDIEDNRRNLQSVTEANDLDEFLNTAVLAGTDFVAEKQNVVVLDKNAYQVTVRAEPTEEEAAAQLLHTHKLTVPRRSFFFFLPENFFKN